MPYLTLGDQRLHYSEHRDDPSGRRIPLVLIHGAGGSLMHWPPGLRRLPDYDVYALDLPGHGRSPAPGCRTIDGYVDVIYRWLQAMSLPKVVLAGHSMGGAICMLFALRYPQRLSAMVLVATGARLRVHPDILHGLGTDRERVGRQLVQWVHGHRATPAQQRQYLRHFLSVPADVLAGDWVACDAFDVMDFLPDITTTTLVVAGTQDQMTPLKFSKYLVDRIPGSDLAIIEGGGHMLMLEQPVPVISALQGFLDSLRGQAR